MKFEIKFEKTNINEIIVEDNCTIEATAKKQHATIDVETETKTKTKTTKRIKSTNDSANFIITIFCKIFV